MDNQVEYGVFDRESGELLSATTFVKRQNAEQELQKCWHVSYACVGVYDPQTGRMKDVEHH